MRADALLIWLAESKERKKGVDNDLQGLSEPTPSVRPSYKAPKPAGLCRNVPKQERYRGKRYRATVVRSR